MAWFKRDRDRSEDEAPPAAAQSAGSGPLVSDPEAPVRPVEAALGEAERTRIATALSELSEAGVDVDDLHSLGKGLDEAFAAWEALPESQRTGHEQVVERFALGIGEHLHRHTDLRWAVVTDAFGTDLAVSGSGRKEFVVVPTNLVAVRWLGRERGWVPGVVGHIVQLRADRYS